MYHLGDGHLLFYISVEKQLSLNESTVGDVQKPQKEYKDLKIKFIK